MDVEQAREFLIPRVIAQAEREGRPLTTREVQILMFEDADLPNNSAVVEAKLASLISRTSEQLSTEDREMWDDALRVLEAEGSYLSLLLIASRSVVDWARIRRIAIRAVLLAIAINYLVRLASRWI